MKKPVLPTRRVRDIMRRDVIAVTMDMPIREAAELFWQEGIGGAPVVDETGKVVGVVSASDILRFLAFGPAFPEAAAPAGAVSRRARRPGLEIRRPVRRPVERSAPPGDVATRTVADIMLRATFSIRGDATIPELARFLTRAGVHRALVFEGRDLAGIVTTFDVLRAVAGESRGAVKR